MRLFARLCKPIVRLLIGIRVALMTQSNAIDFTFREFSQPFCGFDGTFIACKIEKKIVDFQAVSKNKKKRMKMENEEVNFFPVNFEVRIFIFP